jgi:hypothetical protein
MPHLVLSGTVSSDRLVTGLQPQVRRWRHVVLKTEDCWRHASRDAVLVEGVVVEHSRPLHPVAVVAEHADGVMIRLWSRVAVERTPAVQRWLAVVAADVQALGGGAVKTTNIPEELLADLPLER